MSTINLDNQNLMGKKTPRSKGKPKSRTPPPAPPETETETETRNWLDLPRDVTVSILSRLRAIDVLGSAQKVCMGWRNICKDPLIWRTVDMSNGDCDFGAYDLDKMCRHAVDRSRGNLVDINIEHNCTDDLLKYITDRRSGIRRLRLVRMMAKHLL
ncbi:RNI-like superfamily protein [Prunus dulcis]|uniref:RNI-like superfamily protein n=1 Tax=Prunus dulcis TaxID=3755 RepID=A0A4Y1RBA4_PRUDU|nr:RNI-like superfamily protein [Prunus dulcis]